MIPEPPKVGSQGAAQTEGSNYVVAVKVCRQVGPVVGRVGVRAFGEMRRTVWTDESWGGED